MRPNKVERSVLWLVLIGGLVLLGFGLRIFKAWTIQFSPDSDHGIVFLMAKHMAEGVDFPTFFYGQPYMGSLEPAVSALMCRLFGVSSFSVCLGTVLVGITLLPLIYLWGCKAGGRRAGLVALLLALVGTNTNFHFSVAPRGGYMAMMVCGVGTVYLACRIVTQMRTGQRVGVFSFMMLGILAGVGWWSNQLTVVFLLTALVILLLGFSWRLIREGLLPALLSFFIGSAPWWIWNATHQWGTFDFKQALGRLPLEKGSAAFGETFVKALDFPVPRHLWGTVVLVLTGAMVLLFLVRLLLDWLRRQNEEQLFFRLAAPVLCLSLVAVSVTSKYIEGGENCRYMLPLFPALAMMVGWSADWVMKSQRVWVGWILVILLIPAHLYSLPRAVSDHADGYRAWAKGGEISRTIAPLCDGVCYGDYDLHWLNFASGEKMCVATLPAERYAPYARRTELAEHPAILNDYCGLHAFFAYSGGRSRETEVAGVHVDYDLTPPCNDWNYLDGAAMVEARDDKGISLRKGLTDNTMNTSWKITLNRDEKVGLNVEFDKPHALCGVRFVSMEGAPPGCLEIAVQPAGSTNWCEVLPWTVPGGYFWSGSHLKLEGRQTFEEIRFVCPTGGVARLRMKFSLADSRPRTISLDEILFLEQAAPPDGALPSVATCLSVLQQKMVRQFYGPRWMTERLACQDTGAMKVEIPAFVSRSVQDLPMWESSRAAKLFFQEKTGLLMDSRDVPRSRAILGKCGQQWEEIQLGSLTLMVVSKATDENDWIRHTPVFWTEQGCFAEEPSRTLKKRAEGVFQEAMAQKDSGDTPLLMGTLERAIALYEWHQPARRALVAALKASGRQEEAAMHEAILFRQTRPGVPADAVFPDGIRFLGLTLSTNEVAPGQNIDITYFWTCATSVRTPLYNAFVNFQRGKERFQDDHELMGDLIRENIEYQPFSEVFSYTRHVAVPASATAGEYGVVVGIVNRVTKERLTPATHLKVKKKGLELPVVLKILPQKVPSLLAQPPLA